MASAGVRCLSLGGRRRGWSEVEPSRPGPPHRRAAQAAGNRQPPGSRSHCHPQPAGAESNPRRRGLMLARRPVLEECPCHIRSARTRARALPSNAGSATATATARPFQLGGGRCQRATTVRSCSAMTMVNPAGRRLREQRHHRHASAGIQAGQRLVASSTPERRSSTRARSMTPAPTCARSAHPSTLHPRARVGSARRRQRAFGLDAVGYATAGGKHQRPVDSAGREAAARLGLQHRGPSPLSRSEQRARRRSGQDGEQAALARAVGPDQPLDLKAGTVSAGLAPGIRGPARTSKPLDHQGPRPVQYRPQGERPGLNPRRWSRGRAPARRRLPPGAGWPPRRPRAWPGRTPVAEAISAPAEVGQGPVTDEAGGHAHDDPLPSACPGRPGAPRAAATPPRPGEELGVATPLNVCAERAADFGTGAAGGQPPASPAR